MMCVFYFILKFSDVSCIYLLKVNFNFKLRNVLGIALKRHHLSVCENAIKAKKCLIHRE